MNAKNINTVLLLWTLNKYFSVGGERQVEIFWKYKKRHISFVIKVARPISFSGFIIAPNWNKLWANDHKEHIINICFNSKFALIIPSVLSSFCPAIWSALSSLFPRFFFLFFFCCTKSYLNHWNCETDW